MRAQSSSSSSQTAQPAATPPSQSSLSVQARIRARREQRRATTIHDVYSHLYEAYFGAGYLRFHPGDGVPPFGGLQRVNEYSWDVGVTRYYNQKLGVTVDGRGNYGTAFVGPNIPTNSGITHPSISEYTAMIGPTYRFVLQPKYSVSGRVLAGGAFGKFSGDTNGSTELATQLGLYPDGAGVAVSASVPFEYNVSSGLGVRIAPEYLLTNFGSTIQNSLGFTGGVVIRWGKQ